MSYTSDTRRMYKLQQQQQPRWLALMSASLMLLLMIPGSYGRPVLPPESDTPAYGPPTYAAPAAGSSDYNDECEKHQPYNDSSAMDLNLLSLLASDKHHEGKFYIFNLLAFNFNFLLCFIIFISCLLFLS